MSYVLLNKDDERVLPGQKVFRGKSKPWFVTGNDNRSVFVVPYPDYPPLHAQAFAPDVFELRIEERRKT